MSQRGRYHSKLRQCRETGGCAIRQRANGAEVGALMYCGKY
nr:MAG TPA: hypothetical protein [Caudoviricetes sp.]DAP17998.1 MAG TPA: hypothetical protein [Bacteriophage sp.]